MIPMIQICGKLFDGQLKNLEVNNNNKNGGVSFETNEEKVVDAFQKSISPLYKMFVKGEGLAGTVGKQTIQRRVIEKYLHPKH